MGNVESGAATRRNRALSKPRHDKLALLRAAALSAVLLPLFLGAWYMASVYLYLTNGGDFGGLGAGPSDAEPWVMPVQAALLVLAIGLDLFAGFRFYRGATSKRN